MSERTHFTWSVEAPGNRCPTCSTETVLVISDCEWKVDYENPRAEELGGSVEIHEEITGHYCPDCQKLVSLSLNT